ncbi:DNA polymerase eta [Folsomia candida]|uniref:DNA polymerase eta n=1 Tax=Folsomia candida TaxID=158441 RepID=A0A226D8B3_FOLCA|nr:DNA polymerase eta [Folsomia candida]
MEMRGDDDKERVIGLIDMDCFECQVYQRDKPKLKGSPCVVANSKGRIVSVNYEARPAGISRSLNVSDAKKKCENLTVFKIPDVLGKPDNSKLRHASQEVLDIIKDYIGKNGRDQMVLEYSPTDEFYLDLTNHVDHELQDRFKKTYYGMMAASQIFPHLIAIPLFLYTLLQHSPFAALFVCLLIMPRFLKELKSTRERMRLHCGASLIRRVCNEIESKSRMTASGGVSGNKFRAKLASSENKPNGVAIIEGNDFNDILSSKKIRDVPGLKSGLGEKVCSTWGIRDIQELKKKLGDEELLKLESALMNYLPKSSQIHSEYCILPRNLSGTIRKLGSVGVYANPNLASYAVHASVGLLQVLFIYAFRRRGLGIIVMKALARKAADLGLILRAECMVDNDASRQVQLKAGMVFVDKTNWILCRQEYDRCWKKIFLPGIQHCQTISRSQKFPDLVTFIVILLTNPLDNTIVLS